MLAACPISHALITQIPADEEPLCRNTAVYALNIIIVIIIIIQQNTNIHQTCSPPSLDCSVPLLLFLSGADLLVLPEVFALGNSLLHLVHTHSLCSLDQSVGGVNRCLW